jgi:LexA-binding, inner membrane-associated putative hydrolase
MMGHGHAASGLCVGLLVGNAAMLSPLDSVTLAVAASGAALLCDIDCKGSTAETAFGPVSRLAHRGAVELHHMVCALGEHDGKNPGEHRGLTHWWPFWVATGLAVELGSLSSHWTVVGVFVVLITLAVRGLTIPSLPAETQGRFKDSKWHAWKMKFAYKVLMFTPLSVLRHARRHVAKTQRVGGEKIGVTLATGKIFAISFAASMSAGLAYLGIDTRFHVWLGLIITLGMFLHWIGDLPTHMGVPGVFLRQVWKLPRWTSFYAGGPFEIMCLWIPMGLLNTYLLLGVLHLRPHAEEMMVMTWVAEGVGGIVGLLVAIHCVGKLFRRSRVV